LAQEAEVNTDAFIQELEDAGPDEVRMRLLSNVYAPISPKRDIAKDWLARKDQAINNEAQRARDALQAEQVSAASRAVAAADRAADAADRAAAAAEEQARQAQRANRIAATALFIAIAAGIMSLIALAKKIT
jgi:hypothetical protein